MVFLLIYPKIPNYREEMEEEDEEDEQLAEDVQPLIEELPVQEEVKKEPIVQQEKRPTLNDMELEADEEEDEPLTFEDDGREIPYLINREPVFVWKKRTQKRKKEKEKREEVFFISFLLAKRIDKKEAEQNVRLGHLLRGGIHKKLENDWILDFYGYERRPKDNMNIQSDRPYIPKVVDVEQKNTTELIQIKMK
ncbi:MAG: hypothetical protein ACLSCV_01120 [Acutalibacteraceae bacterium]